MLKLLTIPALLIALLAGAMIWSDAGRVERADFAFVNRGDNKTLDPGQMSWMQDIRIAYALWEGLYRLDPITLSPIPGAADVIDISPDKRTYTFHLRPSGRWSNGDPVLSTDFLFEWRRMLESPAAYTGLHHYIKGAQEYQDAYSKYQKDCISADAAHQARPVPPDFGMVGEKAPDDRTFVVTLKDPVPFFPALCAFPAFFPLNEKSMQPFRIGDSASYDAGFTRAPHLLSNGPYKMTEWSFRRRLRLQANEYYWDRASVKSKVIDQIYCDEPLSSYRLYEQGDVDWLADVDSELVAGMLKVGGRPDLHVFDAFGTYYYELNCQDKLPDGTDNPLRDMRVRQAMAMAIDKEPIVRDVARMQQKVTTDFIPPGAFAGYVSPPGLPYDVAAARRLLADAGYPDGKGLPRIQILYNSEGNHGDIATIIQHQWKQNLGLNIDLKGLEIKQFGADAHSHNFTVMRAGWYGDYDDPSTFTDKYLSTGEDNDAGWVSRNNAYDKLCAQAAVEGDHQKRLNLISRAEDILLSEAAIIPLYTQKSAYLFRSNVTGLSINPRAMLMFQSVAVGHPESLGRNGQ
jgi:oligopeptide transport system substrate-binding protein